MYQAARRLAGATNAGEREGVYTMGATDELPHTTPAGIPPELANLTRDGLQEHMLGIMRESIFSTFERSPELVGVTLRREAAGHYWDIGLSRTLYSNPAEPDNVFARFFWDLHTPDERDAVMMGNEQHETPATAWAAACAYLAANGEDLASELP